MGQKGTTGRFADNAVLSALSELQETAMLTTTTANEIWMRTWIGMAENYAAFLAEQTRQSLSVWQRLAAMRNPGEVAEAQRKFAERTLEAYRDETERLTEMASSGLFAMACEARGGDRQKEMRQPEPA